MALAIEGVDWSDELAVEWSAKAAEELKARAVYSGCFVCEIVLEGACPRCRHPMVSTLMPVRHARVWGGVRRLGRVG